MIILTKDEERHIVRAIESVKAIATSILVIDSGSSDATVETALRHGATVFEHPWKNYASQFNWALDRLPEDTEWVLRLDADEVVSDELRVEISNGLASLDTDINGIVVDRRMTFLRRPIRYGGLFPIRVLRIFRHRKGHCENRWMDEHIIVEGKTVDWTGEIVDDNLNSLTWWTAKHNEYASREAVDLLNLTYNFIEQETLAGLSEGQAGRKRWLKENVYARLPRGLRALVYFFYRYVVRLGFLDGYEGLMFHLLQGFWYRFLVDAKLREVERHMRRTGTGPVESVSKILGIDVT